MYAEGKRRDIQLLPAGGVPQERIAKLTGVSARTIRRIGRESAQPGLALGGPRRSHRIARPWRRCWPRRRN